MSALIFWVFLLRFFTFTYECPTAPDYYWRDYSFGTIPYDAIEVNNDGRYIGQVFLTGGLIPATIYPHLGYAITELFGKHTVRLQIKILCSLDRSKLYWDYVDFDKPAADGQMRNAILGGFYKDEKYDLTYFIGKLLHQGEWKASKVIAIEDGIRGLYIWNNTNDKQIKFQQFQMLKYNLTLG